MTTFGTKKCALSQKWTLSQGAALEPRLKRSLSLGRAGKKPHPRGDAL